MKVAFDQNVPTGMVRVLQAFAKENQFRRVFTGIEITAADEYVPKPGDSDYTLGDDRPWLRRFADKGGRVVITGDTKMLHRPHERLALIEHGFVVFFFENQWSNWKFWRKCALLIHWWPVILAKMKRAKKASFYRVPCAWPDDGKLKWISNKDPRLLKIEKRDASARRRKRKPGSLTGTPSDGPLFEYAAKRKRKTNG